MGGGIYGTSEKKCYQKYIKIIIEKIQIRTLHSTYFIKYDIIRIVKFILKNLPIFIEPPKIAGAK